MKVYLEHLGEILLTALALTVLRVLALWPSAVLFLGGKTSPWWAALGLCVYILAVWPLRGLGFMRLRAFTGGTLAGELTYPSLLREGLRRLGRGLLGCVPLMLLWGFMYYGFSKMDFKSWYSVLKSVGSVIGGKYIDSGYIVLYSGVLLFALAAALLWYRDMGSDFRDMSVPDTRAERRQRLERGRKCAGARLRCAAVNILLALPSLCLWALILRSEYLGGISLDYGIQKALSDAAEAIREDISATALLRMALVLVVVHMPLAALRKTRNAVLWAGITEGADGLEAG